jgi:hypothetical protein
MQLSSKDKPPDDGSGFSFLGDIAVKLRDVSMEQLTGLPAAAADASGALIKIRIAGSRTTGAVQHAHTQPLVQRRYAERGYDLPPAAPDPHLYTVAAHEQGQLVGTVGVRTDSPSGLSADELYPDELAMLRVGGRSLCEFTRLAVDDGALSKTVLASLFHTAYLYAHRLCGVDTAVIEVNPRHVPFYVRALQFERIGPERHNRRVDAPAVLLCVPFARIAEGVARYAGKPELAATTRTLYPYGFSAQEEQGILNRLRLQYEARSHQPAHA